ncbi:MAG TPA: HXXEE domain-containing protein [Chitinophagaceae bacterium]|nr:HXXEE domain-containing protein [Chitinophagaceae bacterium]
MFKFLKARWFDVGLVIAFVTIKGIWMEAPRMSYASLALWMGFAALLLHHAEEYHWPGDFPQWIYKMFYRHRAQKPYLFTVNATFITKVCVEWTTFLLAAFLADKALWLGIATMLFCLGNFIKHAVYYNIKANSWYNPGMFTAVVFLLPVSLFFFISIIKNNTASVWDYVVGIPLGIFFTLVSSVKLLEWLQQKKQAAVISQMELR